MIPMIATSRIQRMTQISNVLRRDPISSQKARKFTQGRYRPVRIGFFCAAKRSLRGFLWCHKWIVGSLHRRWTARTVGRESEAASVGGKGPRPPLKGGHKLMLSFRLAFCQREYTRWTYGTDRPYGQSSNHPGKSRRGKFSQYGGPSHYDCRRRPVFGRFRERK